MIAEGDVAEIILAWAAGDTGSYVYRDGARYRLDAVGVEGGRQWLVTAEDSGHKARFHVSVNVTRIL